MLLVTERKQRQFSKRDLPGKGMALLPSPSPKNRACCFHRTRLKPFKRPLRRTRYSNRSFLRQWSFRAIAFNHPSNSQTARAVGASENELQGADFALLALLLRLYDSPLQMTHVAVASLPFDGTPVDRTQARASSAKRRGFKFPTNSCLLRHCHRVS